MARSVHTIMPELPEVETVRQGIEHLGIGHRIEAVEVTGKRTIRRQSIAEFGDELTGSTLVQARRRGKYLLADLDTSAVLVIHLRMSGQVRIVEPSAELAAHTHVRLALSNGTELRFVDPRTFGELFVATDLDERGVPAVLSSLGHDPILDELGVAELFGRLQSRHTSLKGFLLDQSEICGIGNIYADEICFAAKLSPLRRTETLRRVDVSRLVDSMDAVLGAAVQAKGSTLKDARYRDVTGGLGSYQEHHATYDREGLPCPSCGRPIRRGKVIGRSTYFCPKCQR